MTEVTVEEGSTVDIQLVAEGTFNKDFTVDLVFTNGTAGESACRTYVQVCRTLSGGVLLV